MAAPWWLQQYQYFDNPEGAGSGYVATGYRDARTGQPVYEQGGKWYYSLPRPEMGDGEGNLLASVPGKAAEDSPLKTARIVTGQAPYGNAPYGNLGGEIGIVDGRATYLYPMDRGATIHGDVGTYGGAQRVTWQSPSGQKGTVVQGSDGRFWVAPPPDAKLGETDVADHSTVLGELQKTYGPLISAALPFTGIGSSLAELLGPIGGRAATGALGAAATGGDIARGAAGGAIGGAVNELGGPILKDAGLSPEASKAILGAGTAALTGTNPILPFLSGLSPSLTAQEGEITGPMAETPVMGSEGGGYPGAEFEPSEPALPFQPEPPSAIGYGDETQVSAPTGTPDVPPLGDVFNYPDEVAAPGDLAGADIPTPEPTVPEPPPGETPTATEAPELPPLEYTAPEEGVRIPEKLLAAALGIGQQTVPTATAPSPTGTQTRRLGSSDVGASSLASLGMATSPDQAVGAGELESTRTGKKRRNVWNVASLKNLQDALGV